LLLNAYSRNIIAGVLDKARAPYHFDRMAEVVPLKLTERAALEVIRRLAADTSRIVVLGHGKQRQWKWGITRRQIEVCLQKGTITEGPFMNQHGNWQVNMYRHAAGEEITCTVAIEWATKLLVITTFRGR
jgi:hypothetical protein